MKSLARYPRRAAWLPSWFRNPFRGLMNRWAAMTAPYSDDEDDLPPMARYVHNYVTVMAGFGGVALGAVFILLAVSAGFREDFLSDPLDVVGHAVSILTPIPVYLAMRVRRRRWLLLAGVSTVASLALSFLGAGERTSSYAFAMKVSMLIALYTLWRESDS